MQLSIGSNIRTARKRLGITQEELASSLGVTAQAVSRWESETGLPDISMVVPLAKTLSISTDFLFGIAPHSYDTARLLAVKNKIDSMHDGTQKAQSALNVCRYLYEETLNTPSDYEISFLFIERTANLSRYVDTAKNNIPEWSHFKNTAINLGLELIRFNSDRELTERTHFAMAWIYIHEKDYLSAREHIQTLPSVSSNRLRESILAQLAVFEKGIEEEKRVLRQNLRNFCRAINKEFVYAMENFQWNLPYEEALTFGKWALQIIDAFSQNPDMLHSCRGFTRDLYKYMIGACLDAQHFEEAAMLYHELEQKMERHLQHYRFVLSNEEELEKYDSETLRNMTAYTEEFITLRKKEILYQLKEWYGEDALKKMEELL